MRQGRNPNTNGKAPPMPDILAFVVTYLPHQNGYYAGRFEVIKQSLISLRENAGIDIPVLVWDNGSCGRLRNWLQDTYRPEYLVLSKNIGAHNAQAHVWRMFPPDTLIAFADDDIFYFPNWLAPQLEILETYPPAIVTGYPCRAMMKEANKNTIEWAQNNAAVESGYFMPQDWHHDFNRSIGKPDRPLYANPDIMISYNGVGAYATAHHCQCISRARHTAFLHQYTGRLMLNATEKDTQADASGLLMLATTERLTLHMGNVLDDELRKVIHGTI